MPRLRHHANPVLYFPLKQHKNRNFKYPPLVQEFDWKEIFASGKAPVYLDIGSGMGKFLIEIALAEPDINILGFELRQNAVEWVNKVLAGENVSNARVLWYSVVNGIPFIESGSIRKIFYLFPDPWIKKRHHKRRAFSVELLNEFHRMLSKGGGLYIMTDVPELDEHHAEILTEHDGFEYIYHTEEQWEFEIRTNQEEFCRSKEIPFVRIKCIKK